MSTAIAERSSILRTLRSTNSNSGRRDYTLPHRSTADLGTQFRGTHNLLGIGSIRGTESITFSLADTFSTPIY